MAYLFGLMISGFLIILILLKKQKQRADYLLAGWMLTMGVHLLLFYMQYSGSVYKYPHALGLLMPLPVLHGFFLYAYAAELTGTSLLKSKAAWLSLLPFLVLVVLAIPFYGLSAAEKTAVFRNHGKGFEWYMLIQLGLIVLSGLTFSIATLFRIRKHREVLLGYFSDTEKKMLSWLEYLAFGLALIWMLAVFFDDTIVFAGVVLFVLFIGIFGINQVPVFYADMPVETTVRRTEIAAGEPEKYARTGLKDESAAQWMEKLEVLMRTEKPHTNGELTLNDLAALLYCHPHQLSQVINSMYGKTFHHYINSYRIEEFLAMAAQPENKKYTFMALAYDCGFNSKTTFNKYFKLHTGKTPSEYFEEIPAVIKH